MRCLEGGDVADAVVAAALDWVGTPYRHQGSLRSVGCDCLGLVRGIWREIYGREPEAVPSYSSDWTVGAGDDLLHAAQRLCRERANGEIGPGSLLVFRWHRDVPAKHLGIALDARRFIHAYERTGVVASALVPQWRRRIAGIFTFPEIT